MDSTRPTEPPRRLDPSDAALLAAFVLIAVLGTLQKCLLVNDGAVYLAAAWLGNAWDLFYSQNTGRLVSTLLQFGPAWLLRPAFNGDARAFIIVAHALYFAVPLGLWLILRAVEPQRIYSATLSGDRPGADPVHVGDGAGHRALDDLARPGGRPGAIAPGESHRQRGNGRDPRLHPSRNRAAEPGFRRLRRRADPAAPAFRPQSGDRGPGDGSVPDGRVLRDRGAVGANQSDDRRAARIGQGTITSIRSGCSPRSASFRCWPFFGC